MKRVLKWVGIVLFAIVALAAVVPFLIPVRPLTDLTPVRDLAGPGDRFVTLPFDGTDGIDIRYREAGDPESPRAFVLIHGSVFNAATWDDVMESFASKGRVIAYDRVPYGLSEKILPDEWAAGSPYATDAGVARVFELMDALGVEKAVLIGNSYGGVVALRAAALEPERVEALVFVNAAVYVNENVPTWIMNLPQIERIGPLIARWIGGSEAFIKSTWHNPDTMSDARLGKTLIHTNAENWDMAFWAYLQTWTTPALDNIIDEPKPPVLVISGAEDRVVPLSDSERLHSELAGSDLVVLPDCGHVPQEECPAAFSRAVLDWVGNRL